MFEARVIRNFTYSKRGDRLYKRRETITDLTEEEKDYLLAHGVIDNVKKINIPKEKPVERAVVKAEKTEKAVKPKKAAKK